MVKMTCAVNRVVLAGVVGTRGVEVSFQQAGKAMATFTLVAQEPGPGEQLFSTFIPCEAFGKGAEDIGELHAGQAVLVEGKLRWRAGEGGKNGQLVVSAWAWDVRALQLTPEKEAAHV